MKARQVGHRLSICWISLCFLATGWFEPASLKYQVTHQGGDVGFAISLLLFVVCVIGLLDVYINDILTENWRFEWAERHRYIGYVMLAALHIMYVFVMSMGGSMTWVSVEYLSLAAGAIWIACLDTVYYRQSTKQDRESVYA